MPSQKRNMTTIKTSILIKVRHPNQKKRSTKITSTLTLSQSKEDAKQNTEKSNKSNRY